MAKKILLTSFQTWLPHHVSNSSDDLLAQIQAEEFLLASLTFLRQLPVDIALASQKAIATIQTLQPDAVICCGMAESRDRLTIESNASWSQEQIYTSVNLEQLIAKLSHTKISHEAGKFVCEGLYYQVLRYLKQFRPQSHCLFIHVPVLTEINLPEILADFRLILEEMGA
ncbi:pyroglutamyl peptidase I [Pleurocapsa sp. PCC 7327]|uniref:pyroglutamyl-peptidase I family protein n=1 Tax=Pleurocapsa sp. PCC 7327 TaxID=118163 RepID=UPI00029FFC08|nr:pyroglutamyl-peptidase I [Pleurocapsa sp. PCC 7327]AFY77883.1 pyroglutamyl peptidase I [Pleurocapsa sp. PCC 7327]